MSKTVAPSGSWRSPVTTSLLTEGGIGFSQIEVGYGAIYWLEARPIEAGRVVIVECPQDGAPADILPPPFNARTRLHEYGGGSYFVHGRTVFFSNFADQRLYRIDPGEAPRAITPAPGEPAALRYADGRASPDGRIVVCVRESHREGAEAVNEIVSFPSDGSRAPQAIASGADFYSFPQISPDGRRLAWTCWNHPQMPWDGTELWTAELQSDGSVANARRVAGSRTESIFQPQWSPDGVLHFISDRTGWWNLYAEIEGLIVALTPMHAEFGTAQWVFGLSRYAFLGTGSERRVACVYSEKGFDRLGIVGPGPAGRFERIDIPYDTISDIRSNGRNRLFMIVASTSTAPEVVVWGAVRNSAPFVIRKSLNVALDREDVSSPEPIEFPTERNLTAFALFYPPKNKAFIGPSGERPPLLVLSHGGPTAATTPGFRLAIQYWTSRGFAVVDVNYGGSTGYGRAYRDRLQGAWGIVDMEDCINAARFLERRGDVDGRRMAIRGGSAGGYTTLCALVFSNVFAAGASYYGVADLERLAADTHKFESRYLDGLVGPYPAAADIYRKRSPLYFAEKLSCPVILFQGLEDKVVPPSQAEIMIAALKAKRLPYAYVVFPNESHGFRQAENIRRAAEAELYFYSRIFGFAAADPIEPVLIENLA